MISNPNKPNPDQLQFIHPKNSPGNPARYEAAPAKGEEELKTEGPTIVLHPSAVYLVDPEAATERREDLEEVVGGGGEGEVEEEAPVLTSLEPNELPVWAVDTVVVFHGEGFTQESVINWNGGDEVTTFVNENELSTLVKPSLVQAPLPLALPVYVHNGELESNELTFTFIT